MRKRGGGGTRGGGGAGGGGSLVPSPAGVETDLPCSLPPRLRPPNRLDGELKVSPPSCMGWKTLLDDTAVALRERVGTLCFRATNWLASIFWPQPDSIFVASDCRLVWDGEFLEGVLELLRESVPGVMALRALAWPLPLPALLGLYLKEKKMERRKERKKERIRDAIIANQKEEQPPHVSA